MDKIMIDLNELKLTQEELFIRAGFTEKHSVYKAFLETQNKLQDEEKCSKVIN